MTRWAAGVVTVVLLAGCSGGGDDSAATLPLTTIEINTATTSAGRNDDCEVVSYQLSGSVRMDVTMANATGDTEQFGAFNGWNKNLGCLPAGQVTYLSAQLDGSGSVECWIRRDGLVVSHAKSAGQFVIASCSD